MPLGDILLRGCNRSCDRNRPPAFPSVAHGSDSLDALPYIAIGRLVLLSCRLIQIGKEVLKLARVLADSLPHDEAVQAGAEQVLSGFEAMADFALSEHLRPTLRVAHT